MFEGRQPKKEFSAKIHQNYFLSHFFVFVPEGKIGQLSAFCPYC